MGEINDYSTTAGSNNAASPNGWPEAMAPSGLNNSDRELAARIKRLYSDNNGTIDTGGTSTAYTCTLNAQHSAWFDGLTFWVKFDQTNGASPTINPTGSGALGAKSLVMADGSTAPAAGEIPAGAVVMLQYNDDDDAVRIMTPLWNLLDEDTMSSDDANNPPSQQSVKAYVDTATFASGTKMLFQQTSAPTGWTKDTTHNDKALRLVSGTPGSGGATGFTSVFGSGKNTGSTALTVSHLPSTHRYVLTGGSVQTVNNGTPWSAFYSGDFQVGGGGGHTHSLSLNLQYVDVIIASKD